MARVRMSKDGAVVLPQSLRDAHGLKDGTEFEVIDGGREIRLEVVKEEEAGSADRKLRLEEFLAKRVSYVGPPVTDAMMQEGIDKLTVEDWARLERQWHDDKND
jgi:bifunctional DNA-binding transcriptional regulator/antitoxin component of YhaV-PrlF toxin-antitoxin module